MATTEDLDYQYGRTMSIIGELRKGKQLSLPDGSLAMGVNFSIGYVLTDQDGNQTIGGLVDFSIKELNSLLNYHNIGMVIPNLRH